MLDTGEEITTQMPTATGKFSDLRGAIAKVITESVPPGKSTVVFAIGEKNTTTSDAGQFRFGMAKKVGDHWQVMGDLGADGKGKHVTGQVMIAGSW